MADIQGIAVTNAQIQLMVRQQWFVPSAATNEAGGTNARGAPAAIPFDPPVTVDAEGRFELKALRPDAPSRSACPPTDTAECR